MKWNVLIMAYEIKPWTYFTDRIGKCTLCNETLIGLKVPDHLPESYVESVSCNA